MDNLRWTGGPDLLAGKLALVTGAGAGNGRAIALGLAKVGADIISTDIDARTAEQTASAILASGRKAWSYQLDVSSPDRCEELARRTATKVGPINVLVNNAGIIIREGIRDAAARENWRRMIDVNLHGNFNTIHAWLGALRETRGSVVNISSIQAFLGHRALGYSPSKGGVKQLTMAMALDLASDGIRVNSIAPGFMATPMTEIPRQDPVVLEKILDRVPMQRIGDPDELVGPVVFLASDMSSFVTGVTIPVDGGFLAN
jgi:NAD(P)-dependent dehydrogenase (short-subunit alcohol dehydrogenase family)